MCCVALYTKASMQFTQTSLDVGDFLKSKYRILARAACFAWPQSWSWIGIGSWSGKLQLQQSSTCWRLSVFTHLTHASLLSLLAREIINKRAPDYLFLLRSRRKDGAPQTLRKKSLVLPRPPQPAKTRRWILYFMFQNKKKASSELLLVREESFFLEESSITSW